MRQQLLCWIIHTTMMMAAGSSSSSAATGASDCLLPGSVGADTYVSKSFWYLTKNPDNLDVFIWKRGLRLKGTDGKSVGPLKAVKVHSKDSIELSCDEQSGRRCTFRCYLRNFVVSASPFSKKLEIYIGSPSKFCEFICNDDSITLEHVSDDDNVMDSGSDVTTDCKKNDSISLSKELSNEIACKNLGIFNIPIEQLRGPPDDLKVRDVKDWYIECLAGMLREEQEDHEDLTAPMLVVASVKKHEFLRSNPEKHIYYVIGGVQRYNAILKVNSEGKRRILTRRCVVYSSDLGRKASLAVARQHNEFNQIQRSTTFLEISGLCRKLMFSNFAGGHADDGTYMPKIPRYNQQKYRDWKAECINFLATSQVSVSVVEQAMQMALLPSPIFHKMRSVFLKYEEGKLKNQKPHKVSKQSFQKLIEGKFSAKLTHFKIFQGLQDEVKIDILDGLLENSLSFEEVIEKSKQIKDEEYTREIFLREVGFEEWQQAEAAIPQYAHEERLKAFTLKRKKELPQDFQAFCSQAKRAKKRETPADEKILHSTLKVIKCDKIVPYEGSLVFLYLKEMSDIESVKDAIASNKYRNGWSLVVILNEIPCDKIIESCKESKVCRVFKLCSFLSSSTDDVKLANTEDIVVAWFGLPDPPSGHPLATTAGAIVQFKKPDRDSWIKMLITSMTSKTSTIVDIFSPNGEVAHITLLMDLNCLCMISSDNNEIISSLELSIKKNKKKITTRSQTAAT